jgi:prepilin-type N-terminal cleavage/methylation domain-containing protein
MKKGFTLIELLVVIAIIGILASVVLIGFPSATKKAKDSRVISAIGQARTVMTYIGANTSSYEAFKETHIDMVTLWAEIINNNAEPVAEEATEGIEGGSEDEGACIWSKLNAKDDYWYCADTTGVAGTVTDTNPSDLNYCDGTTFICPDLE